MKLVIFTEGTIIMHSGARGLSRKEIVKQSQKGEEPTLYNWHDYIPIKGAVNKLKKWKQQGADLFYLTSRIKQHEIAAIKQVLSKHEFPEGTLLFRKEDEHYGDVIEILCPDIIIEDDCESIGGLPEMVNSQIKSDLREKILFITVKEFEGIDLLPDKLSILVKT
jgi:hypothetical protein